MQCEVIGTADVELQFANGNDDTEFENLMTKIANFKARVHDTHRVVDGSDDRGEASADKEPPLLKLRFADSEDACTNSQRLPSFVRNLTPVVEALLEQLTAEVDSRLSGHGSSQNSDIFAISQPWARLGGTGRSQTRLVTSVLNVRLSDAFPLINHAGPLLV